MMKTLIVSYDLESEDPEYERLYEVLKQAQGWWHYLDSFWIINTDKTVTEWTNIIKNTIKSEDNFIIIEIVDGSTNGWLPQKAWDWIKKNTPLK